MRTRTNPMARLIPWVIFNAANFTYDVINHANLLVSFSAEDGIRSALTLGNTLPQSREGCVWRKHSDPCPSKYILFSRFHLDDGKVRRQEMVDYGNIKWIKKEHNYRKPTVILIHGYAGVADNLPMGVLRDAYLGTGKYNVYQVDWSKLTTVPCYPSSVFNMRGVARCTASFMDQLRRAGVPVHTTTCVGHSLGAHVCGLAADYLSFPMHRIIGIDPARPLIRSSPSARLDSGDANFVEAIHTSAIFGDAHSKSGHVDFCINGAKKQPYCHNSTDEALCSHVRSVCYLAESLYEQRMATACLGPCTSSSPKTVKNSKPLPMGHETPEWAKGLYCVTTNIAPFCPTPQHPLGNPLCCVPHGNSF